MKAMIIAGLIGGILSGLTGVLFDVYVSDWLWWVTIVPACAALGIMAGSIES